MIKNVGGIDRAAHQNATAAQRERMNQAKGAKHVQQIGDGRRRAS